MNTANDFFERIDPHKHGRYKGVRLVAAYALAAGLTLVPPIAQAVPAGAVLPGLAGGFALWANVSELQVRVAGGLRDLALFVPAAGVGAASFLTLAPVLTGPGHPGPELVLVTGAFFTGFLRRYGIVGAGIGSQIYIGQLLAFAAHLTAIAAPAVLVACACAMAASLLVRLLDAPFERWETSEAAVTGPGAGAASHVTPEVAMGLQAAVAATAIVALSDALHLIESAWAITACTYVIANSSSGTLDRARRRIAGTLIGVPLALACLPLAERAPAALWAAAASAMIVYAVALQKRYDIACGAYAFTLIVTLAAGGEHSIALLAARAWETLLGAGVGLATALVVLPLPAAAR